jgi:hypothetical protein
MLKMTTWNLSGKKWLYWTGMVGFVLSGPLFWVICIVIWAICDRGKPKTKDYQIEKVNQKFITVEGNIVLGLTILYLLGIIALAYFGVLSPAP